MAPIQATIYDFDEVTLDKVEYKNPDSVWSRVEVRVEVAQTGGRQGDVIDLWLSAYHAERLARAILEELGEDIVKKVIRD